MKVKFFLPLLMAIVMMAMSPTKMWADELFVNEGDITTISSDAEYECIYVDGGTLIIKEGVTVTIPDESLYVNGGTLIIEEGVTVTIPEGRLNVFGGKTFNYGTIEGDICVYANNCFANHGFVSFVDNNNASFYNFGTVKVVDVEENVVTTCNHSNTTTLAENVTATCSHGGGKKVRCNACGSILYSNSVLLPHSMPETFADGIKKCSVCGLEILQQPSQDSNNNYLLANTGNLLWFRDFVNTKNGDSYPNLSACAKLTANIVFNDGTFAADGTFTATGASVASTPRVWEPIVPEIYGDPYTGTFDGDGHTISGLYSKNTQDGGLGLFRNCGSEGIIKGLGIVNCYFNIGYGQTGAICSWNSGTISNCYSSGTITSEYNNNAGLCSENYGTISNCYSTCSVSAPESVGGICISNYGTIKNCYFAGSLSNAEKKGGICYGNKVSEGSVGTVTNCYTTFATSIYKKYEGSKAYCVETKDASAFSTGEVAYKLNGSVDAQGTWSAGTGTPVWYQRLGDDGDSYPVLKKASDGSNTVYYGYADCVATETTYANSALHATHGHSYAGEKTFMNLNSTELTGFHVCDYGCGAIDGTPTYSRTMKNQWGTIVLPFDVAISSSNPYDFYEISSVDGDELVLSKITGTLSAGTPALIRIYSDEVDGKTYELNITAANNTVNTTGDLTATASGLSLVGAYDYKDITNENGYIISNNAFWNIQTVKGENNVYCSPFRAYISTTSASGARLRIGEVEDESTGIAALDALNSSDAEYYDINGRRLNDLQKGINIISINGKKVKVLMK